MADFTVSIIDDNLQSRSISIPGASQGSKAEFPSAWFIANPGQKPSLSIKTKPTSVDAWGKMLGHNLHVMVCPHIAVIFMVDYISSKFRATLTREWISYGVRIADSNMEITPMALLSIRRSGTQVTGTEGSEIQEFERNRLFYILIAGYRYGLASEILQRDYKATVLGKINQVLKDPERSI